jgi:tRNA pseudouridine32 synthase/23S rRNA pseudouridine746 synthase
MLPILKDPPLTADMLQKRVLHRDALILIIDKPAGVPVHRGPRNAYGDEPLDRFFPALAFGLPKPPELAHRLDRDTSGCLVLGRHRQALARLAEMFKAGQVEKRYWAIVEAGPVEDAGEIDLPLGRKDATRGWWMKVDPAGQPSRTLWRVLGRSETGRSESEPGLAWVEFTPLTGRTHQLRVHAEAMGWPIVGDPVYGSGPRFGGPGLQLHARAISLPLHRSKPPVTAEAPAPVHMLARLRACGFQGDQPAA